MPSPIASAAPNATVAIPKTIVILIAELLPLNRRPYIISDGELKLARLARLSFVERSLPDGRAISAAIMPPYDFLSKATSLACLNAREPRAEELALPKSVENGNLGLNKAVIRWMSEQLCFGADVPKNSPASLTCVDICPREEGRVSGFDSGE